MDDEPIDADSELDINLRSPQEVAERLLILGTVCRRAYLEERPSEAAEDDPEAERFDLAAWLRDEGLDAAATPRESALLEAWVGRLDPEEIETASWQSESLVALGWALGWVEEMPAYDAAANPTALLERIPAPWDRTETFRRGARLRSEATIAAERERAELWNWRAEASDLLLTAKAEERSALVAAIRDVARETFTAGVLPKLTRGDFPARGLAYRDLDPEAVSELGSVARERLRALNWLCGFGVDWDGVPLDV